MNHYTNIKVHVSSDGSFTIRHFNNLYALRQEKDGKFRVTFSPQGEQVWNSFAEFMVALENQDFHEGIQAAK